MRALAALALAALAPAAGCADDAPASGPDAAATCRAPTAAPAWLDGYLATTIAKLAGAADVAPGLRLPDRATVERRAAALRFALDELAAAGVTQFVFCHAPLPAVRAVSSNAPAIALA